MRKISLKEKVTWAYGLRGSKGLLLWACWVIVYYNEVYDEGAHLLLGG